MNSATISTPRPAKSITGLSGNLLLIEEKDAANASPLRLMLVNEKGGNSLAGLPAVPVRAIRPLIRADGTADGFAVLASEDTGATMETYGIVDGRVVKRGAGLKAPFDNPAFEPLNAGRAFAVWDQKQRSDVAIIERSGASNSVPTQATTRAVISAEDGQTGLILADQSASLVSLRLGKAISTIAVADMLGPIATASARVDGVQKMLVLSGATSVLTLFSIQGTNLLRLAPPAQITTDKASPSEAGSPLIATDRNLEAILIGRVGSRRISIFQQIGASLIRRAGFELDGPLQAMTTLPDAGPDDTDVFAFLVDEGTRILLRPARFILEDAPTKIPAAVNSGTPAFREQIASVQDALARAGYPIGAIDGIVGPATVSAIRAFQFTSNLPATGTLDQATIDAILKPQTTTNASLAPIERSGVDPSGYTIYVQFAGVIGRDDINSLITRLRQGGWNVPGGAERISTAAGLSEVRYGTESDAEGASALASALNGVQFSARPVRAKRAAVKPRILEVWISR
ncbi:MAG: peptidoglycan-binding protein [Bradyrhizobium sp.]